jgi:hypothetical protein
MELYVFCGNGGYSHIVNILYKTDRAVTLFSVNAGNYTHVLVCGWTSGRDIIQ